MAEIMTYTSLKSNIEDYLDRSDTRLIAQIPNFIALAEIRCSREVKNLGLKTAVTSTMQSNNCVYLKPNRWLEVSSINFGTNQLFSTTYRQSSSGTRTLTFSSQHNFVVGNTINVFGVGGSGYNGTFTVSAKTQFTVSYVSGSTTESIISDLSGNACLPLENRKPLYPRSVEYCNEYWPDRTQVGEPKFYSDYDYDNWLIVPTPKIDYPFEIIYFERPIPLSEENQTNWFTENARDLILYATLLETAPYLKNDQRIPTWKDYYMQSVSAIKIENKERVNDSTIKRQEQ